MKSIASAFAFVITFGLCINSALAENAPTSVEGRIDLLMQACVLDGTSKEDMLAAIDQVKVGERMDLFTGYDTSTFSFDDGVMIMAAATLDNTLQCAGNFPPGTINEAEFHEFSKAFGTALEERFGEMHFSKDMETVYRWVGKGTKGNVMKVQTAFTGGSAIIGAWSSIEN